jgi:hypothetical protein
VVSVIMARSVAGMISFFMVKVIVYLMKENVLTLCQ